MLPEGSGLRHEDRLSRHRLLTWLTVVCGLALFPIAALRDRLDLEWAVSTVVVAAAVAAAVELRSARLASSAVAVGLTTACAELVVLFDGVTEAHFSFFVAVGVLALYRDWVPFLAFLTATFAHHALMGMWMPGRTFQHVEGTIQSPWFWAGIHALSVLLAAATQIVAWRLTETEERRAREDLSQAQAQFTAAFEEAPIAMSMIAADGTLLRVNPAFVAWAGLPGPPPPGTPIADLPITPISDDLSDRPHLRILRGTTDVLREVHTFRTATGRPVQVEMHARALRDDAGRLRAVVSHYLDVTEKHEYQEALRRQAREDVLTGLLGRRAFETDLEALVEQQPGRVCVIYLDVDRFKHVNDTYGHSTGDQVLRTIGSRLRAALPADAVLARLGGDEFAVAVVGSVDLAQERAARVAGCFEEPFALPGGRRLAVTASVGLSLSPEGITPGISGAEAALQSADLAMYTAKQNGRDRVQLFDDDMRETGRRRSAAEQALRDALEIDPAGQLPVWFQPIVSLQTGAVLGAEALVRLRGEDDSLIPPALFIPLAEETGLIVALGEHVLRTALDRLTAWGASMPYVSVNVSPKQLAEPGFVPMLERELARCGLSDPSRLVLEITETSMLGRGIDVEERLLAISALGVRLALDVFGTGYSSLTWLQSVPAAIVKLDRSFVAGLSEDPSKTAIISAVLWLARAMEMTVVAEGVEELADVRALQAAGCPAAQGWYFSRPIQAHAVADYLAAADPRRLLGIPAQQGPTADRLPSSLHPTF